jgi:hypothetical protein
MAAVFEVIDTIDFRGKSRERFPDWKSLGEGVLAILEPDGPRPRRGLAGRTVTLRRPDGTTAQLVVDAVKFGGGGVPSLFFKDLAPGTIPRGSILEET